MAHRGEDTLRFGPMKPVGLTDPRNRAAAVRRRAAAPGQSGRRSLQPGRLSDAAEVGRAGARAAHDSRSRARRVRAVRHGAPQHLHQRADGAARDVADASEPVAVFRRPDFRRRRLRRIGRIRVSLPARNAAALTRGENAARAAANDRHRRARVLRVARQSARLSADEHHVRHHGAAGRAHSRQAEAEAGDFGARAGRSRRAGRRRGAEPNFRASASAPASGSTHEGHAQRLPSTPPSPRRLARTRSRRTRTTWRPFSATPRTSGRNRSTTLDAADVDAFAIRAFLGELHKQRISASSSARKLSAIRTFVKFLRREDLIDDDPATLVASPKKPETIPAHLTVDEMSRLLEMPDSSTPLGPARPRHPRAVLRVRPAAQRAGRPRHRRREPVRHGWCACSARGGKSGSSPSTTPRLRQFVRGSKIERRWRRVRRGREVRERSQGVEGRRRRRCSSTIAAAACRHEASIGWSGATSPMRREVRHQPACAAALIRDAPARQRRRSSRAIQELLGHARLSTTQRYTHVNATAADRRL